VTAVAVSYRQRLLDGLAASINERGYRDTTVADIVRHAQTSRRSFYAEFSSRDDCFVGLLEVMNARMQAAIEASVTPSADWRVQVRQAVTAYVDTVASQPAITVSWIRELPALGDAGRVLQREAMTSFTSMLLRLVDNDAFRSAGTRKLTPGLALLLLGGLREVTASIVETGGDIHDLTELGVEAATALLEPPKSG
jgi:AcrR family transcriptional regulator